MIRVIVASSENGRREEVYFTEDFETPAEDFFFVDEGAVNELTRFADSEILGLPNGFPLAYVLVRAGLR